MGPVVLREQRPRVPARARDAALATSANATAGGPRTPGWGPAACSARHHCCVRRSRLVASVADPRGTASRHRQLAAGLAQGRLADQSSPTMRFSGVVGVHSPTGVVAVLSVSAGVAPFSCT